MAGNGIQLGLMAIGMRRITNYERDKTKETALGYIDAVRDFYSVPYDPIKEAKIVELAVRFQALLWKESLRGKDND